MTADRQIPAEQRSLIVWLDPGQTTGLAYYDLENDTFFSWQYDLDDLQKRFTETLVPMAGSRMAVGYERFIVTSGGTRFSTPEHALKTISVIKHLAEHADVPLLKAQPSSGRKLASPVLLRRLGWYKPGRPHANDAAQHLLVHMIRMRPMPPSIRQTLFPGYSLGATITP